MEFQGPAGLAEAQAKGRAAAKSPGQKGEKDELLGQ